MYDNEEVAVEVIAHLSAGGLGSQSAHRSLSADFMRRRCGRVSEILPTLKFDESSLRVQIDYRLDAGKVTDGTFMSIYLPGLFKARRETGEFVALEGVVRCG